MTFSEDTLRAEIVKVWGEFGAHVDVYDELLRRARCGCYPDIRDHEDDCPRNESPILQRLQREQESGR